MGSKWDLIAAGDAQQPFMVREHDSKMVSGFPLSLFTDQVLIALWESTRLLDLIVEQSI